MALEFGIQFFPCVGPDEKSAADYWGESLHLVGLCDALGFTSVRTVEHYFHPYGGYSPSPVVFLAAAAMRTAEARPAPSPPASSRTPTRSPTSGRSSGAM